MQMNVANREVITRPAEPHDADRVFELFMSQLDVMYAGVENYLATVRKQYDDRGSVTYTRRIEDTYSNPQDCFARVAVASEITVGAAFAGRLIGSRRVDYFGLVVADGYMRLGIGMRLELERQKWSRLRGRRAQAQVAPGNIASILLLEKVGFKSSGFERTSASTSESLVVMKKRFI